jgi:putative nucleotidyltransferase with HDIG domain
MTRTPGSLEILLVTADPALAPSLQSTLETAGFRVVVARDRSEAQQGARSAAAELAIVDNTLDGSMLACLGDLTRINPALGLLAVVDEDETERAIEAARLGVYDFFTRPIEITKVPIRLQVALHKHRQELNERAYRLALEDRILQRTEELHVNRARLQSTLRAAIEALTKALQWKDVYTESHSRRVASKAAECARALGLPCDQVRVIELGALFHDIGKIGVKDDILNKPGHLSRDEYDHIKQHPLIGEQILSPIEELRDIVPIVKHEHERWDGHGYPDGLKGEDIPLGSRIIAIADAWDSMVFDRVYRPGVGIEEALAEIERAGGRQFDPAVVRAFVAMERAKVQPTA